jgi:hypothetical protein
MTIQHLEVFDPCASVEQNDSFVSLNEFSVL